MPYPASSYPEGVDLTIIAGNQLHEVINGEADEVISTTSGDIPSVRKALADSMMFKVPVDWIQGEVTTDPLETRLYNGQPYWAPEATLVNPITLGSSPVATTDWLLAPQGYRNDYNLGKYQSGILISDNLEYVVYEGKSYFAINPPYTTTTTTPDTDGNLFVGGYTTIKDSANVFSNTNLLSNPNFLTPSPDTSQPAPSATPTSYPQGYQIFSGVFANETSGITDLTYINGNISFSGGDFYIPVANTGGLERLTEFVASVADFDGKPRTRGVSFALVGDEYRVTVGVDALEDDNANATPIGSVKFEQGSVATAHEVEVNRRIYYFKSVMDMISNANVGFICSTENFIFERITSSGGDIDDFELVSVGGLSSTAKYNKIAVAIKSLAVDEWYVNQSTGQDTIGAGYDVSTPARTIQFVIDSMPDMLSARYTQKINLSAGTFNESSRPTSEMARPAIVWPNDKFISNRTTQASGAVTGALVIEGQGVGVSIIQTNPTDGYLYGVYASGCEIALYNLSVLADESDGVSDSSSLVVSHRGAYVHGKNIHIGSANAQLGLVCEAGGWAEMISSSIKDCGGTDVVVYQDSAASLAGAGSDIGHITNNGFLQLAENCVVNGDQLHTPGSQCQVTSSQASTKPTVNGSISGRGSQLNAAFADFNGLISCEMSGIRMAACGYQDQITMFGGNLLLSGTNSYTGVNTQNNSLTPVTLRDDPSFKTDASSSIVNSNGDTIGPDYGNLQVSVGSNGFVIPVAVTGREIDIEVIGAGADRTGATLPASSSAGPYGDGQVLRITGAGFNVQIAVGATADIPNGSITVGGQPSAYSGATFIYMARTSKWKLQSVGLQY